MLVLCPDPLDEFISFLNKRFRTKRRCKIVYTVLPKDKLAGFVPSKWTIFLDVNAGEFSEQIGLVAHEFAHLLHWIEDGGTSNAHGHRWKEILKKIENEWSVYVQKQAKRGKRVAHG